MAAADTLEGERARLGEQRARNLAEILAKQQRAKYFQQAKEGRYVRACKSDEALAAEHEKQVTAS